jgi:hypothetical protein
MRKMKPESKRNAEYDKAYNRGWRYSQRETATLDHGDANNEPDAWYDGYLDMAVGRPKWSSSVVGFDPNAE